jgi:hypothetical protein
VVAAVLVSGWGSPADFAKQFLSTCVLLVVVVFGMRNIVRFNMLGLFLVVTCTGLLAAAAELLAQPDSFYRINGYELLCAMALLLAWPLLGWHLAGSNSTQAATAPAPQ